MVQAVPSVYDAFAYVFGGEALIGTEQPHATEGQMVLLHNDGEEVVLASPAAAVRPLELLLIAGVPLREPVARYGPFVMNTKEEIVQAVEGYQAGRLGTIAPDIS